MTREKVKIMSDMIQLTNEIQQCEQRVNEYRVRVHDVEQENRVLSERLTREREHHEREVMSLLMEIQRRDEAILTSDHTIGELRQQLQQQQQSTTIITASDNDDNGDDNVMNSVDHHHQRWSHRVSELESVIEQKTFNHQVQLSHLVHELRLRSQRNGRLERRVSRMKTRMAEMKQQQRQQQMTSKKNENERKEQQQQEQQEQSMNDDGDGNGGNDNVSSSSGKNHQNSAVNKNVSTNTVYFSLSGHDDSEYDDDDSYATSDSTNSDNDDGTEDEDYDYYLGQCRYCGCGGNLAHDDDDDDGHDGEGNNNTKDGTDNRHIHHRNLNQKNNNIGSRSSSGSGSGGDNRRASVSVWDLSKNILKRALTSSSSQLLNNRPVHQQAQPQPQRQQQHSAGNKSQKQPQSKPMYNSSSSSSSSSTSSSSSSMKTAKTTTSTTMTTSFHSNNNVDSGGGMRRSMSSSSCESPSSSSPSPVSSSSSSKSNYPSYHQQHVFHKSIRAHDKPINSIALFYPYHGSTGGGSGNNDGSSSDDNGTNSASGGGDGNISYPSTGMMMIASGSDDHTVKLWDSELNLLHELSGASQPIMNVCFSHQGDMVLGTSLDGNIYIWNTGHSCTAARMALSGHTTKVLGACFVQSSNIGSGGTSSSTSMTLISGSHDKTIKLWDLSRGGTCKKTFLAMSSCNDIEQMSPDLCASCHFDRSIRLWDTRMNSNCMTIPSNHSEEITSISSVKSTGMHSSPSSSPAPYILTNSKDNSLKIFDVRNHWKPVVTLTHPLYQCGPSWSKANLCQTADGEFTVAAMSDHYDKKGVILWHMDSKLMENGLEFLSPDKERHCNKRDRSVSAVIHPQVNRIVSCRGGAIYVYRTSTSPSSPLTTR